jgi:hypothetical protein
MPYRSMKYRSVHHRIQVLSHVVPYRTMLFVAYLLLLFTSGAVCLVAQPSDVRVSSVLDTTSIRLGEQTVLRITIEHSPRVQVQFPFVADTLTKRVEVVGRSVTDSTLQNGIATQRQTFTVSSFEEGLHDIPALTFSYRKPNDTALYTIQTQALALAVLGVVQDSTQTLRDIKPPMALPRTFAEIAPYLLGVLLVLGGIGWAIYYFRKRPKASVEAAQTLAPKRPAYEVAMESLERVREARLWQSGDVESVKDYHTQLTDILRVYAEQTYAITTLEATTEEIIEQFRTRFVPAGSIEMLRSVLTLADMVKFARTTPLPNDNERSMKLAVEFVTLTALHSRQQSVQDTMV